MDAQKKAGGAEERLTPWFNILTDKPLRVGVYELCPRDGHHRIRFSLWDGSCWMMVCDSVEAAAMKTEASIWVHKDGLYNAWRGLISDSQEKPPTDLRAMWGILFDAEDLIQRAAAVGTEQVAHR